MHLASWSQAEPLFIAPGTRAGLFQASQLLRGEQAASWEGASGLSSRLLSCTVSRSFPTQGPLTRLSPALAQPCTNLPLPSLSAPWWGPHHLPTWQNRKWGLDHLKWSVSVGAQKETDGIDIRWTPILSQASWSPGRAHKLRPREERDLRTVTQQVRGGQGRDPGPMTSLVLCRVCSLINHSFIHSFALCVGCPAAELSTGQGQSSSLGRW